MKLPTVLQFNLSPTLGGAEVYTAFLSRALVARGWATRVVVDSASKFWHDLDFGGVSRIPFGGSGDALPRPEDIVVIHAPQLAALESLRGQYVVGVAHQALYDSTRPEYYDRSDLLLAVSNHVIATLKNHGLTRVYPFPLYGVADLDRGGQGEPVSASALFDPDGRKPRDLILAALTRSLHAVAAPRIFKRRDGLTLGIVSRIAPLKQFATLFSFLTPILLRHPQVNLEIFGTAVGFSALTHLRRALAPLGSRVRFWGHQQNLVAAYGALDYLLTGLPEREALGLNAIESCSVGTPVLAVAATPFSETLRDGVTGFLYTDPRLDEGADFERVLTGIESRTLRPDVDAIPAHLESFSFDRFAGRVDAAFRVIAAHAAHHQHVSHRHARPGL
jgi:glycosyltransferase involved in cell wall biosynthesis